MDFVCPTCNKTIPYDLKTIVPHTEEHIIEVIKKKHPDWVKRDGICKKCYDYYKSQLRSEAG
jgi:hypothetical protein